jgi:hypothetical protein
MEIKGKVIARIYTKNTDFGVARIEIKVPRGAPWFRFFDIVDQGELCIGDNLLISIIRASKEPVVAKVVPIDGCRFYSSIEDWSQCCVCRPTDQPGHYCVKHIPVFIPQPGGCVSVSETQIEPEPFSLVTCDRGAGPHIRDQYGVSCINPKSAVQPLKILPVATNETPHGNNFELTNHGWRLR